jgi:basic membrane protein A
MTERQYGQKVSTGHAETSRECFRGVQAIIDGKFQGGMQVGILENGDVGIAGFHELDALVSTQVKANLEQIKAGIISGEIKTRPDK